MYQVGDAVRFKKTDGTWQDAKVVRVDDKHWVYLNVEDEDGVPYQFADIEAIVKAKADLDAKMKAKLGKDK